MWPGDQQSGGEQYPQGNPPQQPQGPYGQPNPYTQPGYQQSGYPQQPQQPQQQPPQPQYPQAQPYGTPAPYGQPGYQTPPPPGGYPTPQQWGPPVPGGPDGGPPQKNRRNVNIAIAIAASVAVITAVVVGTVYFTGDDKKTDAQDKPTSPTATVSKPPATTPSTTSTPATSGGSDTDNPRGAPGSLDVKPIIPGWKVDRRGERNVAFDVPPDWTVAEEGLSIGFDDNKGGPAVIMGAPAYYKHNWCTSGSSTADRAAVGTKGGSGAKSLRAAAESEATAWAYWAYQDNGKGTFSKAQNSKAFHNSHGITGWQAQATASNVPKANKCSSPGGIAYTVAWLDPAQKTPTPVIWVLYADTGVSDQLAQSVVNQIESTIRPLKK